MCFGTGLIFAWISKWEMCSPFIWLCCLFERFQRTKLSWWRRQVMDVSYLCFGNMNCRVFFCYWMFVQLRLIILKAQEVEFLRCNLWFALLLSNKWRALALPFLRSWAKWNWVYFFLHSSYLMMDRWLFSTRQLQFRFLECCFVALMFFWFQVIVMLK